MSAGGARPGAGRKKHISTLYAEQFRAEVAKMIAEDFPKWASALAPKALGGDVQAWNAIMDRAFGKAHQPITGEDGRDLIVKLINYADKPNEDSV